MSYGTNFKSGGYGEAYATGHQSNADSTKLFNQGLDVGVANPDIQSDDDITRQGQGVTAVAEGGSGGADNVYQNTNV